jgi:hypothetical protein
MNATSIGEVRQAFQRMTRGADRVGYDTSRWILQEGSKTYGRAFRVFRVGDENGNGSGHYDPLPGLSIGYLGMTRAETAHALDMLAIAFHASADMLERGKRDA